MLVVSTPLESVSVRLRVPFRVAVKLRVAAGSVAVQARSVSVSL